MYRYNMLQQYVPLTTIHNTWERRIVVFVESVMQGNYVCYESCIYACGGGIFFIIIL